MVSFLAEVKIFSFWFKMDFSKAFCPILRSFFEILLLLAGRCHSAPLKIHFCMVSFLSKDKIFSFWPKIMD